MPLLIFFFPWAIFFKANRPAAGLIHLVLWVISIPLLFVFGLGFLIWFVQVGLAGWELRKQLQEEQASAIAAKMAKVMKPEEGQPPQAS